MSFKGLVDNKEVVWDLEIFWFKELFGYNLDSGVDGDNYKVFLKV